MNNLKPDKRFLCNDKFMIGNSSHNFTLLVNFLATTIWFIIPCITSFYYYYINDKYYILIIGIVLWLIWVYNNILAIFKDPGVLINGESKSKINELINNESPEEYNKKINFHKYRVCETCDFIRPPKVSHCQFCNLCVKGFDHHCNFIANCVGARNHINFFMLLLMASINLFYYAGTMISIIVFLSNGNSLVYIKFKRFYYLFIVLGILWFFYIFVVCMKFGNLISESLLGISTIVSLIFLFIIYDYSVVYYENIILYYYLSIFNIIIGFTFFAMAYIDGKRLGSKITYKEKLQLKLNLENNEKIKYKNCFVVFKNLIKNLFKKNIRSEL